ncbi:MAG TPA: hypothetical protein VF840_12675 [Terriglobales bacterium]
MKNKLVVLVGVLALLTLPALAQTNPGTGVIVGTYYVDYFSNNPNPPIPGTPDQWIHLVNVGLTGVPFGGPRGYICSSFYVFDQSQELLACCSCASSPNEVISTGVKQLTANTLTGNIPTLGTVKIIPRAIAGTSCNGLETAAIDGLSHTEYLAAWGQHLVVEPTGTAVTETEKQQRFLSDYEAFFLPTTCAFAQYLGSGKGKCTCGTATQ